LHYGIQSIDIFSLAEREYVVFAKAAAINGKAVAVAAEILIECGGLAFRHGQKYLVSVSCY
jgi:hypothetical protein